MRVVSLKIACGLLFIINILKCVHLMTEENFEQLSGVLRSKCMRVVKVPADVPLAIADGEFDESNYSAKCYVQCIMDTLKIMDKKGKLTYLKSIQDTYIPDDWKESFGNAYKMCVTVANNAKLTDKCEIAFVWWKCYYENNPDYFFV